MICLERGDPHILEPSTSTKIDRYRGCKKAAESLYLRSHVGLSSEWVGKDWKPGAPLSILLCVRPPALGGDRPQSTGPGFLATPEGLGWGLRIKINLS